MLTILSMWVLMEAVKLLPVFIYFIYFTHLSQNFKKKKKSWKMIHADMYPGHQFCVCIWRIYPPLKHIGFNVLIIIFFTVSLFEQE